ncbi:hypothetical protein ABTD59_12760, partial [Acinetobacter baumannii]
MEALVMNIIAGFQNNFSEGLYTKFKSYRYRVFVEYLGWELNCPNNEELDQFDKIDTVIYAELSGDFPLGDSRQPIYKSLRPF